MIRGVVIASVVVLVLSVIGFMFVHNQEDKNKNKINPKLTTNYIIDNESIDDAVKGNNSIKSLAINLTKNSSSDLNKAEILYNWITTNIKYNKELYKEVVSGTNKPDDVGAIETYETKSGVCLGYASLYAVMCQTINLPVKVIGGYVYNSESESWQDHAWNQVKCGNNWVNVDTTYGVVSEEFNTSNFNNTHMESMIDWQSN